MIVFPIVGQTGKPVHPTHKPSNVDAGPVTAREARASFAKLGDLMSKVTGRQIGAPAIPAADRLATRSEVIDEMARFYKASEPTFRFTPMSVAHDPSVFRIDATHRPLLERLVSQGCVARVGPLAVGPASGLSPKEFGDALGLFGSRLAQIAHLPSPKWTPMLKQD